MKIQPEDFRLQTTSVWSFPDRGNWATHDGKYRGNWSPYIPRNVLLRYSKENDWVLDQFVGGGTTAVEAKLLNRNFVGIDVNEKSLELCQRKCNFDYTNTSKLYLKKGDARKLEFLSDNSIDLICTHPPYADIIKYSKSLDNDISHLEYALFIEEMKKVAKESYRVLKQKKYCVFLMGDVRKKGHVLPLGFDMMNVFQQQGFKLKEIIIKEQHNCKSTDEWIEKSKKYNFLLLAHEYLFVLEKGMN